jgi:uncharacterized membrane protein YqjE
MTDSDADLQADVATPPGDDGSIRASVTRLVAAGRELAEAELARAKIKGAIVADGVRKWLAFAALAMIFLVMGVTILIVSAIIALAPYVGWLAASLIIAGIAIAAAILCALAARKVFFDLFKEDAS